MTKYKFGDIVLVVFRQTDGSKKQRPALVVLDVGDDDIVAPITSTERKNKGDHKIKNWKQSGLLLHSWVRLAKIACLSKKDVGTKLGVVTVDEKKDIVQVWNKLYKF